jgi:hypothetical protein
MYLKPVPFSNSLTDQADKVTKDIVTKHGFRYSSDFSRLTGMVYPKHSLKELTIANSFHMMLWLLDDYIDDLENDMKCKRDLLAAMTQTVSSGRLVNTENPTLRKYVEYTAEVMSQLVDYPTYKVTQKRVLEYFEGVGEHLSKGHKVTFEEYMRIRVDDSACETVWMMAILPYPEDLEYMESDSGARACRLATRNVCPQER